jgi:hypothetical protein
VLEAKYSLSFPFDIILLFPECKTIPIEPFLKLAKNHIFSLICRYRFKTNAVMLLDMGHTKCECMGGTGQGKKNKNLNVVDVLTVQERL